MIFISILIFIIGVTAILWFGYKLANKLTGETVTVRFKDAEYILDQHHAPPRWLRSTGLWGSLLRFVERRHKSARRAREPMLASGDRHDEREHLKRRLVDRLGDLISYFETSPFFEDPESRELLLKELRDEYDAWGDRDLAEVVPPSQPGRT